MGCQCIKPSVLPRLRKSDESRHIVGSNRVADDSSLSNQRGRWLRRLARGVRVDAFSSGLERWAEIGRGGDGLRESRRETKELHRRRALVLPRDGDGSRSVVKGVRAFVP